MTKNDRNDSDLNKDYFTSGFYEQYWGREFNETDSQETAGKILDLLEAKSGHILDWCGGWGRIAIHLARAGFDITLLDFYNKYLDEAREQFQAEGLQKQLQTVCADCRHTPPGIQADYATCVFNTVGFFDDTQQVKAFKSLFNALKPGAPMCIDCVNLLFIAKNFGSIMESTRDDGTTFRQVNNFNFRDSNLLSDFQIIDREGGIISKKQFVQRLYTPNDLVGLLERAGFNVENLWGGFDRQPIGFDTLQTVILARKM